MEQLAIINESGRFTKPSDKLPRESAEKAWTKYDNDLFQTGRLITCGLYIVRSYLVRGSTVCNSEQNITLYDYLRTIINLNRRLVRKAGFIENTLICKFYTYSNTTWTLVISDLNNFSSS